MRLLERHRAHAPRGCGERQLGIGSRSARPGSRSARAARPRVGRDGRTCPRRPARLGRRSRSRSIRAPAEGFSGIAAPPARTRRPRGRDTHCSRRGSERRAPSGEAQRTVGDTCTSDGDRRARPRTELGLQRGERLRGVRHSERCVAQLRRQLGQDGGREQEATRLRRLPGRGRPRRDTRRSGAGRR